MGTSLEKPGYPAKNLTLGRFGRPKALVVDGVHCLPQTVHRMLQSLGFKTESVNGGLAAMRRLSQSRYDLMVTDLQIPDFDGYALSGWLKHQSKGKDTKVIVMTGGNRADVFNYMNNGVVDRWMFKPFSLTTLTGIVGELVTT
jgi:CheY-like chemotaxis protein